MDQASVHDNRELQRYELPVGDQIVFANYRRQPGRLVITHVEAPTNLRGKGVAGQLMQGMLDQVREAQLKVLPLCPYARAWMQRNAGYRDLMI